MTCLWSPLCTKTGQVQRCLKIFIFSFSKLFVLLLKPGSSPIWTTPKDMRGSQRVLLKKMTHHQTSHPGWVCKYVFGLTPLIFRIFLDWPLGILDYPHWVDQSEAAFHTMRHVLSLSLIPFPFALDRSKRGWTMSPYHVKNLPCLCTLSLIYFHLWWLIESSEMYGKVRGENTMSNLRMC